MSPYDSVNILCPESQAAQLKVIEKRRERNDKISSLLGGYMLRGYKMLGDTCSVCQTILLESREGVTYCVACHELDDQETAKDDPAVSEAAAMRLHAEYRNTTADPDCQPNSTSVEGPPKKQQRSIEAEPLTETAVRPIVRSAVLADGQPRPSSNRSSEVDTLSILRDKLAWASVLLSTEKDVLKCVDLVNLIKECGFALQTLSRLAPQND